MTFPRSIVGFVLCSLSGLGAGLPPVAESDDRLSGLMAGALNSHWLGDQLENLGRIHEDDSHPWLQELWLLGRYQGHYHWSEGSAGDDVGFETRRMRMGMQARLLEKLTLHAQMISGSDVDPFYNGFTELWVQWAFTPEFVLTVGQQKHRFTHDRSGSSRYMNYLERAQLTNMFSLNYTPAVTLQGKVGGLTYYTGLYSNATGRDMGRAFSEFDSGWSFLAAAYYDLGRVLGSDSAHLHFSYLQSETNERANHFEHFRHGLSSALILTRGGGSWISEITLGSSKDQGEAVGLNLQPGLFLTDNLQMVLRYQIAAATHERGLKAQRRYEAPSGLPDGKFYQAGYLGFNFYVAKHRLKLMTGIEYARLGGRDVWTASTMFRFFFGPHSGGAFPMNGMLPGFFTRD
jgi:hypothetical protein